MNRYSPIVAQYESMDEPSKGSRQQIRQSGHQAVLDWKSLSTKDPTCSQASSNVASRVEL